MKRILTFLNLNCFNAFSNKIFSAIYGLSYKLYLSTTFSLYFIPCMVAFNCWCTTALLLYYPHRPLWQWFLSCTIDNNLITINLHYTVQVSVAPPVFLACWCIFPPTNTPSLLFWKRHFQANSPHLTGHWNNHFILSHKVICVIIKYYEYRPSYMYNVLTCL